MEPYAVVETGGKQYLVQAKSKLKVERLQVNPGEQIELKPVLALSDGQTIKIGNPEVEGASVVAKVLEHIRGPKLVAFKKKRRKGYRRKVGHRQELTMLTVETIS